LEPPELTEIMAGHSPSVAAMHLVDEANRLGGRDNITALVLAVRALTPLSASAPENAASDSSAEEIGGRPEKRGFLRRK